ncbi:MAG: primosomal protein N', partial [Rikenellaceae bacterium]
GRAGRRKQQGEVIIQSAQPNHRILRYVRDADYESMAKSLLAERRVFFYPPYSRIIRITLRHSDQNRLYNSANALSALLRPIFGSRLQGPTPPPVDRIASEWIIIFILKIEIGASSKSAKKQLTTAIESWQREHRNIKLTIDVDAQ